MTTRFTLGHGLVVSVCLHMAPLAAYLVPWPAFKAPATHRLELDLHGLVSDEQQVGRARAQPAPAAAAPLAQEGKAAPPPPRPPQPQHEQAAEQAPPPSNAPEPEPKPQPEAPPPPPPPSKPAPAQRTARPPATPASRPVQRAAPAPAVPAMVAPPAPASVPAPPPPTELASNAAPQAQKTLSNDLRAEKYQYVGALAKRLKAELTFPDEAKGLGLIGRASVLVVFSIAATGDIPATSIHVVRSSGFPVLDARAVATVLAASPLAPPPAAMTVTVPLDFVQRP